ncbi:MAG TPA: glycosyltransferase [Thermoleophilaceae bacterium]|nr:glycosyltransferase [Thermoleophilaceae bacterium]
MPVPAVSVVVPTRNRAEYLDVTLASLRRQEQAPAHELLVVDDGSTDATVAVAARHGVRVVAAEAPGGLNAGRNTGVAATAGAVVAFLDDDVWAPPGWLAALAGGVERHDWADAFGGPIRARFEGPAPRACGREPAPITTLDLGAEDREAEMVWGANFAVRRGAFERFGPFDPSLGGHGDEEEWLLGLRRAGGRIAYVADAALDHRRAGDDARLRALARAAYHRGRAARRTDERRGVAPAAATELRNLAGAGWHTARRRCPQGLIMGAHSTGRIVEALRRP